VRDGDYDRAGRLQAAEDLGLARADAERVLRCAVPRCPPGERELVLDGDRHPVERTLGRLGEHPLRLVWKTVDDRVERRIPFFYSRKRGVEQLLGIQLPLRDGPCLLA
jgi:hypothetical protein